MVQATRHARRDQGLSEMLTEWMLLLGSPALGLDLYSIEGRTSGASESHRQRCAL
jgi:hypothetical protein